MAHGTKTVVADAELSTSGEPVVVFSISITSGGTAGIVTLKNGTDSSGTAILPLIGVANQTQVISMGDKGVMFPNGCFIDLDANVTSVTVTYERGAQSAAAQVFTSSGIVIGAGVPVMIWAVSVTGSAADGVLTLYNNSSAGDQPIEEIDLTSTDPVYQSFPNGLAFSADCYVDLYHIATCTVIYTAIASARTLPNATASYATGNIKFVGDASNLSGVVITVGGAVITEGVDWTKTTNAGTNASRLADAINAKAASAGVTAAFGGADCHLTAILIGTEGNRNVIQASTLGSGQLVLSGATMSGGTDVIPAV